MRHLFKFKYYKSAALIILIAVAYIIFTNENIKNYFSNLNEINYAFIFIAGMLFSFGFTAPFAIGFFVTANINNIYLASLIGGLGALVSDSLIFAFIRFSFMDEFEKLMNEKPFRLINKLIHKEFSHKIRNYLLYIFIGFIIASPLPDEVGVIMFAGLTHIKPKIFGAICFLCHTLGIFLILLI